MKQQWGLALMILALVGGRALAQASDPIAKQHYDNAMAAYGLAHYAEAAEEVEKAYERKPQAALLFNEGQAQREAGDRERALVLYLNYLHVYGAQAANGADVRRIIEQLEKAPPKEAAARAAPTPAPAVMTSDNAVVATAPRPTPLYK